jgi:hypothetical protein
MWFCVIDPFTLGGHRAILGWIWLDWVGPAGFPVPRIVSPFLFLNFAFLIFNLAPPSANFLTYGGFDSIFPRRFRWNPTRSNKSPLR